jgi:hypothetical protein
MNPTKTRELTEVLQMAFPVPLVAPEDISYIVMISFISLNQFYIDIKACIQFS